MTRINEMQEFIDDFDPYGLERTGAYANCRVRPGERVNLTGPDETDKTFYKSCAECGNKFIPKRPNSKYCSDPCKVDARNRLARERYAGRGGKK